MTQATTEKDSGVIMDIPLTRDDIRAALIGSTPEAKRATIEVFGVKLDLIQPKFGDIMAAREELNAAKRAADLIIQYACIPGTNDTVFEDSDREMILRWPFGEDLVKLQETIAELTGLNIDDEEEGLKANPLEEPS